MLNCNLVGVDACKIWQFVCSNPVFRTRSVPGTTATYTEVLISPPSVILEAVLVGTEHGVGASKSCELTTRQSAHAKKHHPASARILWPSK